MLEKSPRTIFIHGHPTSMRIEPEIWQALKEMAAENGVTIKALVEKIAIAKKPSRSLSSEIRVFVAGYFRGGRRSDRIPWPPIQTPLRYDWGA